MMSKPITWILAMFVWSCVSGYYLDGSSYGISMVIGGAVSMALYTFFKSQDEPLPMIHEIPKKQQQQQQQKPGEVDFSTLDGFIPPEKRKPIRKD